MEDFLTWLFEGATTSERRMALFTVPERRTRFCEQISAATAVATNLARTQDVYFGVGLIQGTPRGRGRHEDVVGIGALWADVDFAGPAHPDKSLPAHEEDFQQLLAELPLAPSIIVDSGHGRHLYWLLHEPWLFEDAATRTQAAHVARGWHGVVCLAATRHGWALENLGDLTRILRLPGTINRKIPEHPCEVTILQADPQRRYAVEDFENFLPDCSDPSPESAPQAMDLSIALDADPPPDKFLQATQHSALFQQTWDRCRPDLLDQSASAYDLSLATLAVLRGWSDEEIARLLVAWRRRHGERSEKATRPDYLTRTLARARSVAADDTPVDLSRFSLGPPLSLTDVPPPLEFPDPGPIPESLCRVPGFVESVMDHCLATAPYPNVPLAFCGALALLALLTGRKVRDEADNRTNIYLLALAFSAVGKDWPRKVNTSILHRVGLVNALGEKFASGEGIQDSLFLQPAMLFQTDEVDGLLQSINKARDARHENILGTLLTMYSSANSI